MSEPEIEVIIPIDGVNVLFTKQNSLIYRHSGRTAVCDCIVVELDGHRKAIFDSLSEQEDLIYFGWVATYLDHPYQDILDTWYTYLDLDPHSKN